MYVYIFEDGITQQHSEPPTVVDMAMIADGTLMVLQCASVKYVGEAGVVDELESCELVTDELGTYHSPL